MRGRQAAVTPTAYTIPPMLSPRLQNDTLHLIFRRGKIGRRTDPIRLVSLDTKHTGAVAGMELEPAITTKIVGLIERSLEQCRQIVATAHVAECRVREMSFKRAV